MPMVEGGCLCGAIRYRVAGVPLYSCVCHCTTCRRASGAPAVGWVTLERSQLTFLAGEPHRYRSSPEVIRQFCSDCGSALTFETARHPNTIDLTTVSLDDPNVFPPTGEVWLEDRISWQPLNPKLEQYPRGGGS
jgi:hypothetical protein